MKIKQKETFKSVKAGRIFKVFSLLLYLFISTAGYAQTNVSGKVSDEKGEALIGVSVKLKGTTKGDVTDLDGSYSINAPGNGILIFSYVGYTPQEVSINNKKIINIVLSSKSHSIDEVVVVGYGTQKKVNMTGAVSSVNIADMIESRPVTNISSALSGAVAGMNVNLSNNKPSNNGNASIVIRGQGTTNNSSPLVIIDGVESGINSINPQDIETISVLKDASSASIYGSRAANGVILITTKKGKQGKPQLSYNGYLSFESINKTIQSVSDYATYMELMNEGMKNSNKPLPFSTASINAWREDGGKNPLKYPNTDWMDELFKTGMSTQHNISMNGGSESIRFFSSFNYLDNPGVMENSGYERYSLRANVEADIKPWLTLGINSSGYVASTEIGNQGIDDAFTYGGATTPGIVFRAPDGRYGAVNNSEDDPQSNNPLLYLNTPEGNIKTNSVKARMYIEIKPFKGLFINGSYSYESYTNERWQKPRFFDRWNFLTETITTAGKGRTSITNQHDNQVRNFMDGSVKYENNLFDKKLSYSVLAGASQEQFSSDWFSATRYDLLDPTLTVINGAIGESSASGSKSEWAMRSFFGRLNMDWAGKYLVEANLRVDGSSRFLSNNRWGYFPSVSAGWRISEEEFMKPVTWLSNLKIRTSYGSLGNNSIGNYEGLSVYSAANYISNNNLIMGVAQAAISNSSLTWESTYVLNAGIDFNALDDRLSGTIDYFNKDTRGILIKLPAPMVHGNATIPSQNAAKVSNKGIEVTLSWQDKIGKDFSYSVGGNFTHVRNRVEKYRGDVKSISGTTMLTEGEPINIHYVRVVDRIVETDEDMALIQKMVDANPAINVFPYGRPVKGDFLYKDLNNDGIINDNDRTTFGSGSTPKFIYALNLSAAWKGIEISTALQGTAGWYGYYQDNYYSPNIRWGYQINQEVADGRYYEGRTTPAKYPRLLEYTNTKNTQYSDFWLKKRDYLKIRNIQLSYTLPTLWTQQAALSKVRIYGSLENFFTFTKWKGIDPESGGVAYPSMKQAVVGINVVF